MPLRGKGAADLPATVRAVAESSCDSNDVVGFWKALGFQRRYSMVKQGFSVCCHVDGQDVNVTGAETCPGVPDNVLVLLLNGCRFNPTGMNITQ